MIETAQRARTAPPTVAPLPGENRLRADAVSLPQALAQSVSVMAPAMSGAFVTYLAAIKAGGATPLAFLLAMVSCLLIGGVVSSFALRLPSAGSLYTYTVDGLGSFAGFVVGWTYSVALIIGGPAVLGGFAVFTSLVMRNMGLPQPFGQWWMWFAVGVVVYFFLSWFGIEVSTRTQLVFGVATLTTLLLLALAIIGQGGAAGNTVDAFRPAAAGVTWPLVLAGMAFGILSFTGFETAAVLGEETRDPRRAIPWAVIGSVVVGGLFFVAVTYAPPSATACGRRPRPGPRARRGSPPSPTGTLPTSATGSSWPVDSRPCSVVSASIPPPAARCMPWGGRRCSPPASAAPTAVDTRRMWPSSPIWPS